MTPEIAARLAALDIRLMAEAKAYLIFTRGNCLALVQRDPAGFRRMGSAGMMTESGLAYLVWREGRRCVGSQGQRDRSGCRAGRQLRKFSGDLKAALGVD